MHAHQISLNQCRYQSRALSASPSPPPIPPQPNYIQYKQKMPTFEAPPPPPPRCYQLISIRETANSISANSPKMHSFGRSSIGHNSYNRNNYENIRDITKSPFVVKDPRRKPYYYNELNQSIDAELAEQNTKLESTGKSESIEPVSNVDIQRNSDFSEKIAAGYGSGGSLNHIF